mgnify:CR=1 FL=1
MPIILGIESTAHTFGVALAKNGKILSNIKKTYTTDSGGIIPSEASKHHELHKHEIYFEALDKSNVKEDEIEAIAFSQGPGLALCLLEGLRFAKELSTKLKIPLVPVNHCVAHLVIGELTGAKDPVLLYVSGANTQVIAYEAGKYRIFGETLDLGVGNFIDTFGRMAGIGFPAGQKIQELAEKSNEKNYIELPYSVKGMDIALSGIQTNLKQKLEKMKLYNKKFASLNSSELNKNDNVKNLDLCSTEDINKKLLCINNKNQRKILAKPDLKQINKRANENGRVNYTLEDLAYSLQETVFAMLVEVAERALAHTGKKELLLGGGVACNKRLQEMARIMCSEREEKVKLFVPEAQFLVDNAGMIAFLGEKMFKAGLFEKNLDKIDIKPRERTDEVDVKWKWL